jgi:hypothetical protein
MSNIERNVSERLIPPLPPSARLETDDQLRLSDVLVSVGFVVDADGICLEEQGRNLIHDRLDALCDVGRSIGLFCPECAERSCARSGVRWGFQQRGIGKGALIVGLPRRDEELTLWEDAFVAVWPDGSTSEVSLNDIPSEWASRPPATTMSSSITTTLSAVDG